MVACFKQEITCIIHSIAYDNKYTLKNIHINIIKRIYTLKIIYILDFQKENVLKCFTHILFILLHQDLLLQCLSHIVFKGQWTHIEMSHFTWHFMALINLKISLESNYTVSVLCNKYHIQFTEYVIGAIISNRQHIPWSFIWPIAIYETLVLTTNKSSIYQLNHWNRKQFRVVRIVSLFLRSKYVIWVCPTKHQFYHQTSNLLLTLVDNKLVDHSGVVGASPVDAAPNISSFST